MENLSGLSGPLQEEKLYLAFPPQLLLRIADLGLSIRTTNCMRSKRIQYIGDLVHFTESEVLKFRNFGAKSFLEMNELLSMYGLRLGMVFKGWPPKEIKELSLTIKSEDFNLNNIVKYQLDEEILNTQEAFEKYSALGLLNKVKSLGLSVRSARCLNNEGIIYIGDLILKTESELLEIPSFGQSSLNEVKTSLNKMGLSIGMELRYWRLGKDALSQSQVDEEILNTQEAFEKYSALGLLNKVESLGLSVRSARCLDDEGIIYVGDLILKTESELLKIPTLGQSSLNEVKTSLNKMGLSIGMKLRYWPLGKEVPPESKVNTEILNTEEIFSKYSALGLLNKIESLSLSVRSARCLNNEGIIYVGDLILKTESELLEIPTFGQSSLNEVKTSLNKMGLSIGMELRYWRLGKDALPQSKVDEEILNTQETFEKYSALGLLNKIESLGLSVRSARCLDDEGIIYVGDLILKTESELLKIPTFGQSSLNELKISLNKMNLYFGMELRYWPIDKEVLEDIASEDEVIAKYLKMGLLKKIESLGLSFRAVRCLNDKGIIYIGDLILKSDSELLEIPTFGQSSLNELKTALSKMELHFGMELKYWPLKNIETILSENNDDIIYQNDEPLKEAFWRTMQKIANTRSHRVIEARFGFHGQPRTLRDTAQELGVSKERVRQIQKKIIQTVLNQEIWDDVLRIRLRKLMNGRTTPLFLDTIGNEDAWFSGFSDNPTLLENLLFTFSEIEDLNFLPYEGKKIITYLSDEQWHDIKYDMINMLEHSINVGYTMDDIEMFINDKLKTAGAPELSSLIFELLSKDLNFSIINGEMTLISIGNSLNNHLKALLETIDEPIHYENIAVLYEQKYGMPILPRNVHCCLANGGFALFDRGTYGLLKHLHIPPSAQDYIRQKIEETILAGPTERQWHAKDFINLFSGTQYFHAKDFINLFSGTQYFHELNIYTINIILKHSSQLRYLGKFLWKTKSDTDDDVERLHIRQAIYEALKKAEKTLKTENLQDLVSQSRGIGNFFNIQPNELYSRIDPSIWGLLERDFVLSLPEQENLKHYLFAKLTVSGICLHKSELLQKITSINPPEALTENQILGILVADPRFKTWHGGFVGLTSWTKTGRKSFTTVIKEIAESVTDAIHVDDIIKRATFELGHDFKRYNYCIYLNKFGLSYDKETGLWKKV